MLLQNTKGPLQFKSIPMVPMNAKKDQYTIDAVYDVVQT